MQTRTHAIYYTYDAQDKLISMNLTEAGVSTEYYYIRNAQDDIIGLLDGNGNQVVSYTYSAWGEGLTITGSLASTVGVLNPYRYRGYRYDTETGLYYLQSRYYNPQWGRFINADDPLILGVNQGNLIQYNMFAYCGNNPVNYHDPSGLSPLSILLDIVSFALTAVTLFSPNPIATWKLITAILVSVSIVAVAIRDYTNTQKSLLMKYKNNTSDPAYKKAMTEATLLLGISFAFAAATGIASYLGIQANKIPLSLMKSIALGVSSGIGLGGAVPSVFLDFSLLYRNSRR